jgi:hypothetical protein
MDCCVKDERPHNSGCVARRTTRPRRAKPDLGHKQSRRDPPWMRFCQCDRPFRGAGPGSGSRSVRTARHKCLPDLRLLARFCKPATTSGDCRLLCRRAPCAACEVSRLARASRIEDRTRGTLHHPVAFSSWRRLRWLHELVVVFTRKQSRYK